MQMSTKLRILIVDDNPDIHIDFIKILTTNSAKKSTLNEIENQLFGDKNNDDKSTLPEFNIDTATQGQEGVAKIIKAKNEGSPYALAFVDIRMPPGWDGIETIQHIWEVDPDIQVVICTAYSDYSWEETVDKLGQRENLLILKKPFDHIAVRQLSCALTKKWQLLQESREYTQTLEEQVKTRTHLLEESLSITRGTFESSADGILVINNENKIIDYNNKIIEILKIPESMFETKDAAILFEFISQQMQNSEEFLKLVAELTNNPTVSKLEKLKCHNDIFLDCYSQSYKINDKNAGRIWSFRDITKRAMLEEKLEHQALHDPLTGLPNRALLTNRICQTIAKANRNNSTFTLTFFDLDRFKLVNDSLSHAAGDELLQEVAKRVRFSLREEDTIARLGGDEFVIVTESVDKNDLMQVPAKLLACFTKPFEIFNTKVFVTSSVGVSVFPVDSTEPGELLRKADMAMYRSKELGGNHVQFYNDQLGKESAERLKKEAELRNAITNNEFFLCYQPQIDVATKSIVSVEALIRWQHPTEGILYPLQFIPLAQETGMLLAIDEWVLRKACQQNKLWQDQGLPKIRIAVNLTSHSLKQGDLVTIIKNILQGTGLEAEYLELELTENSIINNPRAISMVGELKELGLHFSLDNFGSSSSTMNYLKQLPIDRLKIDQSFVQNINTDNSNEIIIQAIISMARELKLDISASGVETQKQLDFLTIKKCAKAQGFYFSKPLLAPDLVEVLKSAKTIHTEILPD